MRKRGTISRLSTVIVRPNRITLPWIVVFETGATLTPLKGHRLPDGASTVSADLTMSGAEAPLKGHVLDNASD